ncbi:hypothetical protein M378DRAFT_168161 [Amanita muscaria Koide BX008]|uniref:Uncharacterized protein n=1 Tax=Amanita muscaria (strain Koide BX008) TaxID=946122 RepID=A0A0C2SC20_AMAMK|nr:hypothetical protein M378DRAFT_168161 [Amanita muscaria Koide BX008]
MNLPVSVEYELVFKFFKFADGLGLTDVSYFRTLALIAKEVEGLFAEYVPWALRCEMKRERLASGIP